MPPLTIFDDSVEKKESWFYYHIVPSVYIPSVGLTYGSKTQLEIGQVVIVPLRKKLVEGVVAGQTKKPSNYEAKEIEKVLPFIISQKQMEFINIFSSQTLNSLNLVLASVLRPLISLSEKKINTLLPADTDKSIKPPYLSDQPKNELKKVVFLLLLSFEIEKELLLRIKDIIRTKILKLNIAKTKQNNNFRNIRILTILPEKKIISKIADYIKNNLKNNFESGDFNFFEYTDPKLVNGQKTTAHLLNSDIEKNHKTQVNLYFSTKIGVFLPFPSLDGIVLIDEASPLHHQDQNRLYYDSKEVSFFLATTYNSPLFFISSLPSVRLYNRYPEEMLDNNQKEIKNLHKTTQPFAITTFEKTELKSSKVLSQSIIKKIRGFASSD